MEGSRAWIPRCARAPAPLRRDRSSREPSSESLNPPCHRPPCPSQLRFHPGSLWDGKTHPRVGELLPSSCRTGIWGRRGVPRDRWHHQVTSPPFPSSSRSPGAVTRPPEPSSPGITNPNPGKPIIALRNSSPDRGFLSYSHIPNPALAPHPSLSRPRVRVCRCPSSRGGKREILLFLPRPRFPGSIPRSQTTPIPPPPPRAPAGPREWRRGAHPEGK